MRTVVGYHACPVEYAKAICAGAVKIEDWRCSANKYDWLGDGIYFWENGLRRARQWGNEFVRGPAGIVRAEIDLGVCLDLSDTDNLSLIREMHARIAERYRANGWRLPENRDLAVRKGYRRNLIKLIDSINTSIYWKLLGVTFERKADLKLRFLDSLVLNTFLKATDADQDGVTYQTVRCPFEEGEPIFPGSMIRAQSHVQISVRGHACIRSVALVP